MVSQPTFFEFAAEVGLTKHIGGVPATDKLIELCHIEHHHDVLDVGCGVGVTATYIAKKYGSRVVGVDITAKMIERCNQRAEREQVTDRVEFRVADAQTLPFDDDSFDAVITESVTALTEDQHKAVKEYARVAKPGGYVGLNETVWLKTPPPPDVVAWASQDIGSNVQPQTCEVWVELLDAAGLSVIHAQSYEIETREEASGLLKRYGVGSMLRVFGRIMALYLRSPDYRQFVKSVRQVGVVPEHLNEYFGYGLFIGRK